MSISIRPELESWLRARAEAEGITVESYVESMVRSEQRALEEIEKLALEGLHSGESLEPGPGYWEEKHRRLEERLNAKR